LLPFNNKHNLAHLRHIEAFQRKIRLQKKIWGVLKEDSIAVRFPSFTCDIIFGFFGVKTFWDSFWFDWSFDWPFLALKWKKVKSRDWLLFNIGRLLLNVGGLLFNVGGDLLWLTLIFLSTLKFLSAFAVNFASLVV
jgi:hypothetical protein